MRLATFLLLVACQREQTADAAGPLGKERADCRPDKTCDEGLWCLSNLCVRPPQADCAVVGEQMASIQLGNYAEPEERAPIADKYKAACEAAHVEKDQGVCIGKAKDRWAAAQCAPRMFPDVKEDCASIGDKTRGVAKIMYRGQAQYVDAAAKAAALSCTEDKWPAAVIHCELTSNEGPFGYGACNALIQPFRTQLAQRFQTALQTH